MLSLMVDPALVYPDADDFYSPDERFPEYRFEHLAAGKNPVYRAVRDCFVQSGLDQEHLGAPSWNPLGVFIRPGSRVFVLCNFVFHRVPGESAEDFAAKCVHGSVLRALLDYVLLAVGQNGRVRFGNASMQNCHWESVFRETGAQTVAQFYQSNGAPVQAKDLRLFLGEKNRFGAVRKVERRDEGDGVIVNLAADSLLVEIDREPFTPYRVMNYSPARTEAFHTRGSHAYVINREILEADIVIDLAKLKTHEKTGITGALKSCVGAVGHKDSLPHHRFGPPTIGGDEYPSDATGLLRMASAFHDQAQRVPPGDIGSNILRVTDRFLRLAMEPLQPATEGAWWGNDTAWRMVLDLARILTYATSGGEMQTSLLRKHLVLVDGVIGGEGQGPLHPKAVHSGLLLFADSQLTADWACALMMGFEAMRIPMLREALRLSKYPLLERPLTDEQVSYNGRVSSIAELESLAQHQYEPAFGWRGKL